MRRICIFIAAILCFSCNQKKSKDTKPSNDSTGLVTDSGSKTDIKTTDTSPTATKLAMTVSSVLKLGTGGEWVLVDDATANWPKDAFDYFVAPKRKEIADYPYIASADFNGDGRQDAAALVNKPGTKTYAIAILHDVNGSVPNIKFWNDDVDVCALIVYPKGDLEGLEGEKAKMKADGIGVEYYETSSFVVYWNGSAYKRIWTSD